LAVIAAGALRAEQYRVRVAALINDEADFIFFDGLNLLRRTVGDSAREALPLLDSVR
jgi:hypothetical protein